VISGRPVVHDLPLRVRQPDLPGAHQALQLPFNAVLPLRLIPRLQFRVIQFARMASERERDDVVEFVVGFHRRIEAAALQQ